MKISQSRIKGIGRVSDKSPTMSPPTSSNPVSNYLPHNMSLEEVIKKVTSKPSPPTDSTTVSIPKSRNRGSSNSRRRSSSVGAERGLKESRQSEPVNLMDLFKPLGRVREGTPDSDLGYGTSVKSSPDEGLLDLVNAMKFESTFRKPSEPASLFPRQNQRKKISSISEQDPAVAQAVKSNLDPNSNSFLSTLFGYNQPQPPTHCSVDDLFSTQQHFQFPEVPPLTGLENVARMNRTAASYYDATCTWSGQLPVYDRTFATEIPLYSSKVFLGGVPWDITEMCLLQSFKQFGNVKVEWPGRGSQTNSTPKGYVYIVFENETSVPSLLENSTKDYSGGGSWFFRISSKRIRSKEVQVIPWRLADSNFVLSSSPRLDPNKTVFVGALHGMLTAEGLAHVFNDLFGGVIYAGVDTDRFKYPIGSGRVTFNNNKSYMKAVSAAFVEIKTQKFNKKVQVDPYLEDRLCSTCGLKQGPYFCREMTCFTYFCRHCWEMLHCNSLYQHHRPLMRNSKDGPTSANRPLDRLDIFT